MAEPTQPPVPPIPTGQEAPQATQGHWDRLYAGLDGLDDRLEPGQRALMQRLDTVSPDPKEARARVINQAYLAEQMPGFNPTTMSRNWPAVKAAYAKQAFGMDVKDIPDTALYGQINKRLEAHNLENTGEIKPWTLKDRLAYSVLGKGDVWAEKQRITDFWQNLVEKPLVELGEAPHNLANLPGLGWGNPALAAAVWNGIRPTLESAETPLGLATLGVAPRLHALAEGFPLAKAALMSMEGVFTGLMGYGALKDAHQLPEVLSDPNASFQDKVTAGVRLASSGGAAILGGLGMAMEMVPKKIQGTIATEIEGKRPAEAAETLEQAANVTPHPAQQEALRDAAAQLKAIDRPAIKPEGQPPEKGVFSLGDSTIKPEGEPPAPPASVSEVAAMDGKTFSKYAKDLPEGPTPEALRVGEEAKYSPDDIEALKDARDQAASEWKEAMAAKDVQKASDLSFKKQFFSEAYQEATETGVSAPKVEEPDDKVFTSIKNAITDKERVARGLKPLYSMAKRSHPAVWDQAVKLIDQNPGYPQELVNNLVESPRPLSDLENMVLLNEKITRKIAFETAANNVDVAKERGTPQELAAANTQFAAADDKLNEIDIVNKRVGAEQGRGLAARRAMAKEDYSLAQMSQARRAAKGGERLTEGETEEVKATLKKIDTLQDKLDRRLAQMKNQLRRRTEDYKNRAAGAPPKPRPEPIKPDREARDLQTELDDAKQKWRDQLREDQRQRRTKSEKVADAVVGWSRNSKLLSVALFPKLAEAGLIRVVTNPVERLLGQPLRLVPGLGDKAIYELGASTRAEVENVVGLLTSPPKVLQKLIKGKTDIDTASGGHSGPKEMMSFIGNIHGAIKEPVRQGAFRRSVQLRTELAARSNVDIHEPGVQVAIDSAAAADANGEIYLGDNLITRYLVRLPIQALKRSNTTGAKSLGRTLEFLMPIVNVPTNIAIKATRLNPFVGFPEAFTRLALAAKRGQLADHAATLPTEDAVAISKAFKAGAIGTLLTAYAWTHPEEFGGAEDEGGSQKGKLKTGEINIFGVTLPAWMNHAPEIEWLNATASARRIYDRYYDQDGAADAGIDALAFATMAPVKTFPFIQTFLRLFQEGAKPGRIPARLIRDAVEPGAIPSVLRMTDEEERAPQGFTDELKMGVPGLRGEVPTRRDIQHQRRRRPNPYE